MTEVEQEELLRLLVKATSASNEFSRAPMSLATLPAEAESVGQMG